MTSAATRITCEIHPGLLLTFRTASDKSWAWRPGNEASCNMVAALCLDFNQKCISCCSAVPDQEEEEDEPQPSQPFEATESPIVDVPGQKEGGDEPQSLSKLLGSKGGHHDHVGPPFLFLEELKLFIVLKLAAFRT